MKKVKMPVRKWTAGRGALIMIAVLFGMSAILRLASDSGQAIAKEVVDFGNQSTSPESPAQCEIDEGIGELVADLNMREASLIRKERELDELAQTLSLAKDQIRLNMAALVDAEENLSSTIAKSESAAETDLEKLTAVYENMKPKEAATLFEEMNASFAAGFIGRMRAESAAQLMAGLSPKTAYTISVILAGRNTNAPTE